MSFRAEPFVIGLCVHALGLIVLHVVFLGRFFVPGVGLHVVFLGRFFALGIGLHVVVGALVHAARRLHFLLGPGRTAMRGVIAIRRGRRGGGVFTGRRVVFSSGSLRVDQTGPGDQRHGGH